MENTRRVVLHVVFWVVYFGVNLFNQLYLSPSFTADPSADLFFDAVKSQLLIMSVKMPSVYYLLYSLIPRWFRSPYRLKLVLEFILVFFFFLLCYRGVMQYVIWPFIYKESPPEVAGAQLAARFIYSLLDLMEVTGIAAAIKLFRLRIAAMKNEKLLLQEKLQSEMQHLRSQINPHFLFNTLNSIYALSRMRSDATPDAVMRLSSILRYMLYEAGRNIIAIDEEIRITSDYIQLQQIRFGNKVQVRIEKEIDDTNAQIMPLILLPLVENAFKHGASGLQGPAEIILRIVLTNGLLHIEVQNPQGTLSVKQSGEEGIGLKNIHRRLQLVYREYEFLYGEEGRNFKVTLNINLNSYAGFELLDRRR